MAIKPGEVKLLGLSQVADIIEKEVDNKLLEGKYSFKNYENEKFIFVKINSYQVDNFELDDREKIMNKLKDRYYNNNWNTVYLSSNNSIILNYNM